MKLNLIARSLTEMAGPAQVCPKCGHSPIHKTHNYNAKDPNNKWKCKLAPLPGFPQANGSTPANAPANAPAQAVASRSTPAPAAPAPAAPAAISPVSAPPASTPAPRPTQVVHTPGATKAVHRAPGSAELHAAIKRVLSEYEVKNYTINADDSVDVADDVQFSGFNYKTIPFKMGRVDGSFTISGGYIRDISNGPSYVGGNFMCINTEITSFKGAPEEVGENCSFAMNDKVTSIEGLPAKIGGNLNLEKCSGITSLKGIHKIVKEVDGEINLSDTKANDNLLGLLAIKGVESVKLPNNAISEILDRHLKSEDKDLHQFQEDLIEAGFGSAAKM